MNFLTLPQPDPMLLAFLSVKKFAYLEALAVLALARIFVGQGLSRWMAGFALLIALAGSLTVFAPMLGLAQGAAYAFGARALTFGQGMSVLMLASGFMLLSAILPVARWRLLDVLHLAMIVGIWGFWWYVS